MRKVVAVAVAIVMFGSAAGVASAGSGSDDEGGERPRLVRQPTPEAVVAEHIDALNSCDVDRLMAQYPKSIAILLPGGVTVEGRSSVRALFDGVCLPFGSGGLNGIHFTAIKSWTVGKTINLQWVANAPFLAAPYYGADAYETQKGLLALQVTTFDAAELQFAA
jgi:hypothetical protein